MREEHNKRNNVQNEAKINEILTPKVVRLDQKYRGKIVKWNIELVPHS